jgi:hypothetical protein
MRLDNGADCLEQDNRDYDRSKQTVEGKNKI